MMTVKECTASMSRLIFVAFPLVLLPAPMSFAGDAANPDELLTILAMDSDAAYGEYLGGECAGCHSANASTDNSVPKIHGQSEEAIVRALLEYRDGIRNNTTMKNVVTALGPEEMGALAAWLASH